MSEIEERKKAFFERVKNAFSEGKSTETQGISTSGTGADALKLRTDELFQKLKQGKANWAYWLAIIPVLIIGYFVRTRNLPLLAGKYLIELDSYFWFRYAKIIYEQGALPVMDMMRYVPVGYPTAQFRFFPTMMVYLYKFVHIISPSMTQIQWHIIYPPVITVLSFVFFFLFVKEVFNYKTALLATAFLAVLPAYIQRTSAGFADHEAIAMLYMFASLWLFALMWKSENLKKSVLFGAVSGLFAGLMAMVWGGFRFLTLIVAAYMVAGILFTKPRKEILAGFAAWAAIAIGFMIYTYNMTIFDFFKSIDVTPILFALIVYAVYCTKISDFISSKVKFLNKSLSALISTGLVLSIPALGLGIITPERISGTFNPVFVRWASTVAESMTPQFFGGGGWADSYGIFMWLSILAGALAIYKIFEIKSNAGWFDRLKLNKFSLMALAAYFAFVLAFAEGRSGGSIFGNFFAQTYLYWLFGSLAALFFIYLYAQRMHPEELISKNKAVWVFVFLWLFLTMILARMQIRLLFAFAPVEAFTSGLAIIYAINKFLKFKKGKFVAIGIILLTALLVYLTLGKAIANNRYMGSMIPGQWEAAMNFLRDQTPENSVVAHWWDYGHMTIDIGERAAVTDGGNTMSWNHASARYFLTGKNETTTLEYLKSHNVTHILISEEEIPKYPAFSLIGSDENFDRYSQIGVFALQQQREVRDGTMLIYGGGWPFDGNVMIGNLILPAGQAAIGGFSIVLTNTTISNPIIYTVYNNQQYQFSTDCIYANGQKIPIETDANSTLPLMKGCVVLAPYIKDQTNANAIGGAFWLSEKVYDTNFARWYMYNETDLNFKLVYSDNTPLAIYQGRVIGPIKIWEVHYPAGVKADPKYLEPSLYG